MRQCPNCGEMISDYDQACSCGKQLMTVEEERSLVSQHIGVNEPW